MFQTNQRKTQNTAGKDSTHFLIPINYKHLAVEHNPPKKKNMQAAKVSWFPGGVEDGNVFFFQIFSRWRSGLSSAKFCGFAALWTHNCHPVPNEQKLPETLESPRSKTRLRICARPRWHCSLQVSMYNQKKWVTRSQYSFCVPIPKKQWTKNLSKYFLVIFRNSTGFYFCWCFFNVPPSPLKKNLQAAVP